MKPLYEKQRQMSDRHRAALKRGRVALLDIGTSKIACLIVSFETEGNERETHKFDTLTSFDKFRVIGFAKTQSHGVERGDIVDLEATTRAVRSVLQKASKMAQTYVDYVLVCTSGGRMQTHHLSGEVQIAHDRVTYSDISAVIYDCDMQNIETDREILHAMPLHFSLDGAPPLKNPLGQIGHRLSVDLKLVTIQAKQLANIEHVVQQCDLHLAGIVSAPYCAGLSALVEDEQEGGATCIDIGGGVTSVSIFFAKGLFALDSIRVGGDYITSDLSQGLGVPKIFAERIKARHGGVVATSIDDRDIIPVENSEGALERDRREFTRSEIIHFMRPRVEQIFNLTSVILEQHRFDSFPSQRVVLTGGTSQILGLEEAANHFFGHQVRIGHPLRVRGLPKAAVGPDFAAVVGLAIHSARPEDECWDYTAPQGSTFGSPVKNLWKWVRKNF